MRARGNFQEATGWQSFATGAKGDLAHHLSHSADDLIVIRLLTRVKGSLSVVLQGLDFERARPVLASWSARVFGSELQ